MLSASALQRASREDDPCRPFIVAVSAWINRFDVEVIPGIRPTHLAEIGRHAPELADHLAFEETDHGIGAGQRLRGALMRTLAGIARLAPTVVLLDDVQEADEQTLLLLANLSDARPDGLMVLATAPNEFAAGLPLRRVQVPPLPPEEARDLATAVRGSSPDEAEQERDVSTGGNPFLIVNQTELGRIEDDFVLPQIGSTGEAGREVLRLAALLGSPFELRILHDAMETDVNFVLILAEERKLIQKAKESGTFEFTHSLIRDAMRGGIPTFKRGELARRLIEVLGYEPESAAARLGLLKEVAATEDIATEAAATALEAGEHAAGLPNYEAARTRCEEGLKLVREEDVSLKGRLLVRLGHCLWSLGAFGVARECFLEAWSLTGLAPAVRAEAVLGFGGRLGFAGATTDREYIGMLRNALADLPERHESLRLRLRAALAGSLTFAAETDEEREERENFCVDALAEAQATRDPALAAEILSDICWTAWKPDRPKSRRDLAETFVRVADESLDVSVRIEARIFRIASSLEDGEMAAVWRDVNSCEEFAERSGQPHFQALVVFLNGMRELLLGAPEEADKQTQKALAIGGGEKNPAVFELYGAQILLVRLFQGRVDRIRSAAEAMAVAFPRMPALRAGLGLIYWELGRSKDAERQLAMIAENRFEGVPRDLFWIITIEHAARLAVALGDRERCEELYELLRPFAGRVAVAGGAVAVYGAIDRALGQLAGALGDGEQAVRHLRDAVRINEKIGARCINAFAMRDLAEALRRDGGGEGELEELLGRAANIASSNSLALEPQSVAQAFSEPVPPSGIVGTLKQRGAEGFSNYLRRLIEGRSDEWIDQWHIGSRLLRRAMPTAFVPSAACGWTGEIELEFQPPIGFRTSNPYWTFQIEESRARIFPKRSRNADLRMTMSPATFFRLVAGTINPVEAWLDGRAIVDGDPTVAARLIEMFSGPTHLPDTEANV